MVESAGRNKIGSLRQRWVFNSILSNILFALALAMLSSSFIYKLAAAPFWWSILLFIVAFILTMVVQRSWKISDLDVCRFLNLQYPQLEESATLMLKPAESLNPLEKLQLIKVEQAMLSISKPGQLYSRLKPSALFFLLSLPASIILAVVPYKGQHPVSAGSFQPNAVFPSATPVKLPAGVASVSIKITPPAYTGKNSRVQDQFNVQAEQGAELSWQISTTIPVNKMDLIINDKTSFPLRALNSEHTLWAIARPVLNPGFYQLKVQDKLSELYTIEMIPDQPPTIRIDAPKAYTSIDFGESQKVTMKAALSDDYGITTARVFATIASGSGEAVKFKQQELTFPGFKSGSRQDQLQMLLDLPALGVQPGDELYFYVTARDNHNQEKRSDVYVIAIQDTAQLMSMTGLVNGIDLKPEYFRSQRQIIIETEQLIRDKDTISEQDFKNRSNNLGIDQKLLRMRYGRFLGEESEEEIGKEHDGEDAAPANANDFGNGDKIKDQFTHKHDNAEDATFFEPQLKAQLKATLTEMWNSELQLRTYHPQDARPFEYKALRLLKDLQQKSRAYVAKTGFTAAPLSPEKRLKGDLSKISQLVSRTNAAEKLNPEVDLRSAVFVLEQVKNGTLLKPGSAEVLHGASRKLSAVAGAQPALYVKSVAAMRRIVDSLENRGKIYGEDVAQVEKALQRMIAVPHALPQAARSGPDQNLSNQYFKNLNRLMQ